jgi:hypothetical protein
MQIRFQERHQPSTAGFVKLKDDRNTFSEGRTMHSYNTSFILATVGLVTRAHDSKAAPVSALA